MRRCRVAVGLLAIGSMIFFLPVAGAPDEPVTMESLLEQMAGRDALARWPDPAYTLREASSHDRRKVNPKEPVGWHSNNDHEQFIRTEKNGGREEWVIMEDTGPGAVTRFWTPLNFDRVQPVIRFYLDGSATPAIECKFFDLLGGQGFVKPPLAFTSWNETDVRDELKPEFKPMRGVGGDLYLPITFAKSCKITLDHVPFYDVINYRMYDPSVAVKTFSMEELAAAQPVIDRISDEVMQDPAAAPVPAKTFTSTLGPGAEMALNLPAGPHAVEELMVKVDPRDAPQVLRSIVVQGEFDGESDIWCPLSEFFGVGARLKPVRDRFRTVLADGEMRAHWIMPYRSSGRIHLKNAGATPVVVTLAAGIKPWNWDARSMHFHASWRSEFGLKTRPRSDWNYIEVDGRGVYVGDTLTVFNPVKGWYGEGDERVYVDGENFPSMIGTGTEDYYGFAWGMPGFFSSPFISSPGRDVGGGRSNWAPNISWMGYTTTSRVRLLDAIPFRTHLKFDMEIWDWDDTSVDYAAGIFWYAFPGATSNREPQWDDVKQAIKDVPADPQASVIPGALEMETLAVSGKSPGLQTATQESGLTEGKWSGGAQLFVQAKKVGDFIEFQIPAGGDKPRGVTLYATKGLDYGILRFTVQGQPTAGGDFDGYHPQAVASGPIALGTFQPVGGKLTLRVEVVGANSASKGLFFGLDCVVLGTK